MRTTIRKLAKVGVFSLVVFAAVQAEAQTPAPATPTVPGPANVAPVTPGYRPYYPGYYSGGRRFFRRGMFRRNRTYYSTPRTYQRYYSRGWGQYVPAQPTM